MHTPLIESYWPADHSVELLHETVGGLLRRVAEAVPDRVALVDGQRDPALRQAWTYGRLLTEAEAVARALLQRFAPGDRIAIWAPNRAEWVVLQQAIAMAGLQMVALNPNYRSRELSYVLGQSRAAGLFHTDEYRGFDMAALVEQVGADLPHLAHTFSFSDWDAFLAEAPSNGALPSIDPQQPAQIQYTSGTTGFPKGAWLHHFGVVNASVLAAQRARIGDGAVYVNAMPMYHIGGGSVTELGTVGARGTFVLLPEFDPALVLELIEAYRGTHTLLVPTMLVSVLDHPDRATRDVSSLEVIVSGSAPVSAALVERTAQLLGCPVSICFGQTELHGIISQTETTDDPIDQAETLGRPLPQVEVCIADPESGAYLPVGQQGEIRARGYQTMLGYFELPEATAQTIDADGWLCTGDLGSMDERGFLKITGRIKDMIIRGGLNISPREVEEVLLAHPSIADVAVIGVPDERWGEQVAAVLRLADDAPAPNADELRAHCRVSMAPFKTPTFWFEVDAYPMTPSGKIQKFVLRDEVGKGTLRSL